MQYEAELEKKENNDAAKRKEAENLDMAKEMRESSLQTLKQKAKQGWFVLYTVFSEINAEAFSCFAPLI